EDQAILATRSPTAIRDIRRFPLRRVRRRVLAPSSETDFCIAPTADIVCFRGHRVSAENSVRVLSPPRASHLAMHLRRKFRAKRAIRRRAHDARELTKPESVPPAGGR